MAIDGLTKLLNQRLAKTISNTKPAGTNGPGGSVGVSKFDAILNQKTSTHNSALDTLSKTISGQDIGQSSQDMEVFSADDIQINVQEGELANSSTFNAKDTVSQLFSTINNDALKMDSIIEVLSSNDTKLNRRQLLAYQASIGTLSINTDLFSKLAQSLSQNINTLLQTNMG